MIVSRIAGGLGNQMFQYALGRRLAARHNTQLLLDTSLFATYNLHAFGLHHLNIQAQIADNSVRRWFPFRYGGSSWWRRWVRRDRGRPLQLVKERQLPFQPAVLDAADHSYIAGYWQCERYFDEIRPQLLQEFAVRSPQAGRDAELAALMQATNSVMLHVRRGDYVSDPAANRRHGTCDLDYYQRAVASLARDVGRLHLFVFSDDPAWCRDNIQLGHETTVVDHNDASRNFEDLRLMSQAKHFVIANSSFSWWGAWLGSFPDKIVCAPQLWFRAPEMDGRDVVPTSWRRF